MDLRRLRGLVAGAKAVVDEFERGRKLKEAAGLEMGKALLGQYVKRTYPTPLEEAKAAYYRGQAGTTGTVNLIDPESGEVITVQVPGGGRPKTLLSKGVTPKKMSAKDLENLQKQMEFQVGEEYPEMPSLWQQFITGVPLPTALRRTFKEKPAYEERVRERYKELLAPYEQRYQQQFLPSGARFTGKRFQPQNILIQQGQISLPATITTTSEALQYLMENYGLNQEQAIDWIRKNASVR